MSQNKADAEQRLSQKRKAKATPASKAKAKAEPKAKGKAKEKAEPKAKGKAKEKAEPKAKGKEVAKAAPTSHPTLEPEDDMNDERFVRVYRTEIYYNTKSVTNSMYQFKTQTTHIAEHVALFFVCASRFGFVPLEHVAIK